MYLCILILTNQFIHSFVDQAPKPIEPFQQLERKKGSLSNTREHGGQAISDSLQLPGHWDICSTGTFDYFLPAAVSAAPFLLEQTKQSMLIEWPQNRYTIKPTGRRGEQTTLSRMDPPPASQSAHTQKINFPNSIFQSEFCSFL